MTHRHWPKDHPFYPHAKDCPLPTIKACDLVWTQHQHGHQGTECVKEVLPENKMQTCILRVVAEKPNRHDVSPELEARMLAFIRRADPSVWPTDG